MVWQVGLPNDDRVHGTKRSICDKLTGVISGENYLVVLEDVQGDHSRLFGDSALPFF